MLKSKQKSIDEQLIDVMQNFSDENYERTKYDSNKLMNQSMREVKAKVEGILHLKVPPPDPQDEGDQSQVKGDKAQLLRNEMATSLDYHPACPALFWLSDWLKAIYSGDYKAFLGMIEGKSDEDIQKMISKRETLWNVSAIFHVVLGARVLQSDDDDDPVVIETKRNCRKNLNVMNEHEKILVKLLSLGCDVNVRDFIGFTPLHHCCNQFGNPVTLKLARRLIRAGAKVNAISRVGSTPILEATHNLKYDIVEMLIENGANPYLRDNDDISAFRLARANPKFKEMFWEWYLEDVRHMVKKAEGLWKCAKCGVNDKNNKKCTGCYYVFYCSLDCQREHWDEHKDECKAMQSEYVPFHCFECAMVDFKGKDWNNNPGKWKKQHFVVKVSLPLFNPEKFGYERYGLSVINKDMSLQMAIRWTDNLKHIKELDDKIKADGYHGVKGYFHALVPKGRKDLLLINVKRILHPQPW